MKLKLKKVKGQIEIELATDSATKPLKLTITPDQVGTLIALLNSAMSAEKLGLELEL